MAQSKQLAYTARTERRENGTVLVSFPDIPEVLTEGARETKVLTEAADRCSARRVRRRTGAASRGRLNCRRSRRCKARLVPGHAGPKDQQCCVGEAAGNGGGRCAAPPISTHRSHIEHVEVVLETLGQRLVVAARAA